MKMIRKGWEICRTAAEMSGINGTHLMIGGAMCVIAGVLFTAVCLVAFVPGILV